MCLHHNNHATSLREQGMVEGAECVPVAPPGTLSRQYSILSTLVSFCSVCLIGGGGVGGWGSLVWLLSFLLDGSQKVALRDCPPRSGGGSSMGLLRGLVLPPTFFPH